MLKIYFGKHKDEIYNTDVYYENQYGNDWTTTDFAKKIIKEIDCSEVIGPDQIKNDLFGVFNSTELSTGVKTLLLMHNQPKKVFNISNCGDNCAPFILEIAKDRDITVCLHHYMDFGDDFELRVINDRRRKIIADPEEFLMLAHEYLKGDYYER